MIRLPARRSDVLLDSSMNRWTPDSAITTRSWPSTQSPSDALFSLETGVCPLVSRSVLPVLSAASGEQPLWQKSLEGQRRSNHKRSGPNIPAVPCEKHQVLKTAEDDISGNSPDPWRECR